MALLLAADVIESQLEDYLHSHGLDETWGTQERVLVCITPRSNAIAMIDTGKRNADRFNGELYVLYVRQPGLTPEDQAALDRNIAIAIERGANCEGYRERAMPSSASSILPASTASRRSSSGTVSRKDGCSASEKTKVERLIELAEGIDVRIFPQ